MADWDILYAKDGRQESGVPERDVKRMLAKGELRPDDCLRRSGEARWRQVAELKGRKQDADGPAETEPEAAAAVPVAAARVANGQLHSPDEDEDAEVAFSRKNEIEPLDMTPMVDVTLLLLLFFMVTASYTMQKIMSVPKPDPDKKNAAAQTRKDIAKEFVVVEIDHRNNYTVDDEPLKGIGLKQAIDRARLEGNKNKLFLIADGDSVNGAAVKALDIASAIGMEQVMFSVRADE